MLNTWRTLTAGLILGSLITAGIFTTSSITVNKSWQWKWPTWTGIGEDKIIKTSTERLGSDKGQIQKVTITEEPQPGKTLWDLAELFGSLAVPFLLLYLGNQIQEKDRETTNIKLREDALQGYLDRVSGVLIDKNIRNDSSWETIKDVVRTRTLTVLRSLESDGERKGSVIRFLVDADLLGIFAVDLNSANLEPIRKPGICERLIGSEFWSQRADVLHRDRPQIPTAR